MHTLALARPDWINLAYLLAAVLFILGLKMLSAVPTARRGNLVSSVGMLIATVATLFYLTGGTAISLVWIAAAMIIGGAIGAVMAVRVPMTGMPQMVALLNGFGGLASLLVACGDYGNTMAAHENTQQTLSNFRELGFGDELGEAFELVGGSVWYGVLATGLTVLVGAVTFTGSVMAFGKLQGVRWAPDKPVQFAGQRPAIAALLLGSLALSLLLVAQPTWWPLLILITLMALALGVLVVIGIGGADMPVVIALLNSYSGIAAAFAGFALTPPNFVLIITGSLVGASGIILCQIMCRAMNRSLINVLFGGVGGAPVAGPAGPAGAAGGQGIVREFSHEDGGVVLESAQRVMIVPGYGMAVAQAQHAVKELAESLESRGIEVRYAIHPVAGRMPGHMNVLLAEAGVPYEQLLDLDGANAEFERTDVALVIGANDVTNPAARHAKSSPIYGMPILDVDKARQVFVIKRSMSAGFAGVDNELYFRPNCGMLFGDAKKVVTGLVGQLEKA